jgi:hypothetical protein
VAHRLRVLISFGAAWAAAIAALFVHPAFWAAFAAALLLGIVVALRTRAG